MMHIKTVFSKNLKKYRKKAKLTQEKLAEMCNTDYRYIGQLEIGTRSPSLEFVGKIADALNIAPFLLFLEENDSFPYPLSPHEEMLKAYEMLAKNMENVVCEAVEKAFTKQYQVAKKDKRDSGKK